MARPNNGSRAGPGDIELPSDYRKAVQREVFKDALFHPTTILPAAGAGGVLAWGVIVGTTPLGVATAIGLGVIGASAWVINYVVRGPTFARKYNERFQAELAEAQEQTLTDLEERLRAARFKDGLREFRELQNAYQNVRSRLENQPAEGQQLALFLHDIEEAYKEALRVLEEALAIHASLRKVDISTWEEELQGFRDEKAKLPSSKDEARQVLDRKIQSLTERIQSYEKSKAHLDALLARSNEIEGIFEIAALEAGSVVNLESSALFESGGAASRLANTLSSAAELREASRGTNGKLDLTAIDRALGVDRETSEEQESEPTERERE